MTEMSKTTELYNFFKSMSPAELAKLRDKRQETSTRDKERFLKKVEEVEEVLKKLNVKFTLEK